MKLDIEKIIKECITICLTQPILCGPQVDRTNKEIKSHIKEWLESKKGKRSKCCDKIDNASFKKAVIDIVCPECGYILQHGILDNLIKELE